MTLTYLKGIKEIPDNLMYEKVYPGWFGVMYKTRHHISKKWVKGFNFYSCRDGYQGVVKTRIIKGGVFFSHEPEQGDRPARFLQKIEEQLKLSVRSKFRKTNHNNILWIKLSPWWLENKIRRSFLTLMLRAGMDYTLSLPWSKENVFTVAAKNYRGESTLPAIRRFMRGNTVYVYDSPQATYQGWQAAFEGRTVHQVRHLLVSK
jgi:hypothetical protein